VAMIHVGGSMMITNENVSSCLFRDFVWKHLVGVRGFILPTETGG